MKYNILATTFFLLSTIFATNAVAWDPKKFTKPTTAQLKEKLSEMEYRVTQKEATEPPFDNAMNGEKREGIYVDIVSGEPLFSSQDKFESGTGWPSFSRPLVKENIVEKEDKGLFGNRTEVRSKHADSHLGHVFDDGPKPTGLRYCMNSAAMKFIPKADLEKFGFGEYLASFKNSKEATAQSQNKNVVFAGGCFWCMEPAFDQIKGVIATTSGYSGGLKKNPTYEEVSAGTSGHLEVLQVTYNPALVSYDQLLEVYWKNIDPLDENGQFCDKGPQYQSAIFAGPEELKLAEASLKAQEKKLKKKIATRILPLMDFYAAESYHQNYYQKNPVRYKFYRYNCGRDKRLKEIWN